MSNRQTPYQSTASTSTAGTTPVALSLTSVAPSVVGKLLRLTVTMTSGATTTATIELINSVGPTVISKWPDYPLTIGTPFDAADVPIPWSVPAPANLQVRITTDDAGNSTALNVKLIGEAT